MSIARPRFLLGASNAITFPMATVSGLSLAEATPNRQRQVATIPLLHQQKVAIVADTPAATTTIEMRLLLNVDGHGAAHKATQLLWDTIGTAAQHLWLVDDDTTNVLVTSAAEIAGSAQVVAYTAPAKSWFATGDFMFIPSAGGGSANEVVVVSAKTDGTPSFTATLAAPHSSGVTCYRVAMVYPDSVLAAIRPSSFPLGKGSLVLSWVCPSVPLSGTSLPS